jgi:hypothetical protein
MQNRYAALHLVISMWHLLKVDILRTGFPHPADILSYTRTKGALVSVHKNSFVLLISKLY